MNLNSTEKMVLIGVAQEIVNCTSGQFGFSSDMKIDGITKNQKSGYISQLVTKGLVWVDSESTQMMLTREGITALKGTKFSGQEFEVIGEFTFIAVE